MGSSLVLRTERLLLRPVRLEDAPLLWPFVADRTMTRWLSWDPHRDESVTRAFLREVEKQHAAGTGVLWGIFEEGAFRGLVGIEGIRRQVLGTRMDQAELGYWLGRPFHGRGLMTEAAGAAVAAGFAVLRLHKVRVRAMAPNAASLRVIRKLGFRQVGTLRREVLRRGRWLDMHLFERLEDDPAPARPALPRARGATGASPRSGR
jgi:ribosomal-protein-alanine N-acetyltransferase